MYLGFPCNAVRNNTEHQDDVFYPQLKRSASGSHSTKRKGYFSYPSYRFALLGPGLGLISGTGFGVTCFCLFSELQS